MSRTNKDRPPLCAGLSLAEFRAWYRLKTELVAFARLLGLPANGSKPELVARIEAHLRGGAVPRWRKTAGAARATGRDSDKPLRRSTPVRIYKSDDKTRAFFRREIGARFHFTYHLNQWRKARKDITYGDLVDEWLAEEARRSDPGYKAPLAAHGEYNLFVRAFFAEPRNKGRSMRDAARAWNKHKGQRR